MNDFDPYDSRRVHLRLHTANLDKLISIADELGVSISAVADASLGHLALLEMRNATIQVQGGAR
jgi:hypothetical protein